VVSQSGVNRAFVKKFDDTTLDIWKLSKKEDRGVLEEHLVTIHVNFVWLIDDSGRISRKLGTYMIKSKSWIWFGKEISEECCGNDESVRSAIQKLAETDRSTYVVLFENGQLTIFKPPQKELTLKQWYDARLSDIKKQVAEEVAAV